MFPSSLVLAGQSFCRRSALAAFVVFSIYRVIAAEPAPIDSPEQFFALDNLPKIEVFIAEDAWNRLRFSWHGTEQQEQGGKSVNIKSEYEPELADVVINGVRVTKVGIRRRAFSALSPPSGLRSRSNSTSTSRASNFLDCRA